MQYKKKQKQALEFLQETSGTDGNDGASNGNVITTGTEGTKLKKKHGERRRNKLDNITDNVLEVSLANGVTANTDVFF
jgi:hypothetical protein